MKSGNHLNRLAASTLALCLVIFGLHAAAEASFVTYELGGVFTGAKPTSSAPWLTASFSDNGGSGSVTLTLTASLDFSGEFISQVVFNVNPAITPGSLTINQIQGTGATFKKTSQDAQQVDGAAGMGFDVLIALPTVGGPNNSRFDNNDVLTFTITGGGITASSFAWLSMGGSPNYVAAHVQGIPLEGGGTTSGFIGTVPIPPAVWLLGSGLLGLIGIRRRFRRSIVKREK